MRDLSGGAASRCASSTVSAGPPDVEIAALPSNRPYPPLSFERQQLNLQQSPLYATQNGQHKSSWQQQIIMENLQSGIKNGREIYEKWVTCAEKIICRLERLISSCVLWLTCAHHRPRKAHIVVDIFRIDGGRSRSHTFDLRHHTWGSNLLSWRSWGIHTC